MAKKKLDDAALKDVNGGINIFTELAAKTDRLSQQTEILAQKTDMLAAKIDLLAQTQKVDMLAEKMDFFKQKEDLLKKADQLSQKADMLAQKNVLLSKKIKQQHSSQKEYVNHYKAARIDRAAFSMQTKMAILLEAY